MSLTGEYSMSMQGWRILLKVITLIGGFLMLPLGTFNSAAAQEPDVDISVAYGWWQVIIRPETRFYISETQFYREWDIDPDLDRAFKIDWIMLNGHFRKLGKNRYLFTVRKLIHHPGNAPYSSDCPFKEITLHIKDWETPFRGMRIVIGSYQRFDDVNGFRDSCGGTPSSWPDLAVRRKLAKQK
jgi:hypothetical protein